MSSSEKQLIEAGTIMYKISKGSIVPIKIVEVTHHEFGHYSYQDENRNSYFSRNIHKTIFYTKAEAEDYLDYKDKIKQKRALLIKYEDELNKKFNIQNHRCVR